MVPKQFNFTVIQDEQEARDKFGKISDMVANKNVALFITEGKKESFLFA